MNELQIFNNEELKCFEKTLGEYMGVIYLVEYGDMLKIGKSKQPYTRLKQIKNNAVRYGNIKIGRIAVSKPHTNYGENEKEIHSILKKYREGRSELFDISLDDAMTIIDGNEDIKYLDESTSISRKSDCFKEFMSDILFDNTTLKRYVPIELFDQVISERNYAIKQLKRLGHEYGEIERNQE